MGVGVVMFSLDNILRTKSTQDHKKSFHGIKLGISNHWIVK